VCVCVCATLLCCGPHSFARPCALRFWRPAILCGRSVAAKRIWAAKARCGGRGAARVWRAQSRPPKREEEEEAKPRLLRATRAAPPHCATPWEPTLPDGKVLRWLACAVACLIRSRPPAPPPTPLLVVSCAVNRSIVLFFLWRRAGADPRHSLLLCLPLCR